MIEKLAEQVVDTTVNKLVHNTAIETVEKVAKAASDMPGHTGIIAGKLGDVVDGVQNLVEDVGELVVAIVDVFDGDDKEPATPVEPEEGK